MNPQDTKQFKVNMGSNLSHFKPSRAGQLIIGARLAELMGVTPQTIVNWKRDGCPHMPHPDNKGADLYDSAKVIQWRFEMQTAKLTAAMHQTEEVIQGEMSAAEADRREKVAKALLSELKLANEQEKVANIDDLMGNFASAATNTCAALLSWKNALPGLFAHKDEEELAVLIDDEVSTILTHFQEYTHDYKSDNS